MSIGKMLKAEIDSKGLRYKFVGQAVGIPVGQLNKYLNGHQPMPEVKVRAVCLTFSISLKKFGLIDYTGIQEKEPA